MKFYPYKKGGGDGKSFSHAEGEHKKCPPFKRGLQKSCHCIHDSLSNGYPG